MFVPVLELPTYHKMRGKLDEITLARTLDAGVGGGCRGIPRLATADTSTPRPPSTKVALRHVRMLHCAVLFRRCWERYPSMEHEDACPAGLL